MSLRKLCRVSRTRQLAGSRQLPPISGSAAAFVDLVGGYKSVVAVRIP
jgi:hypothetical protein